MNIIKLIILAGFLISYSTNGISRGIGETEITTEDGIEVFQNEKYYLLKKNVIISSDDFKISSDNVKANFEIDLYDITSLETKGNSALNAIKYGINGKGDEILINIKSEEITVIGKNSLLNLQETKMSSDGSIKVNNLLGTFELKGVNSNLKNDDLDIYATDCTTSSSLTLDTSDGGYTVVGIYTDGDWNGAQQAIVGKSGDSTNFLRHDLTNDRYEIKINNNNT